MSNVLIIDDDESVCLMLTALIGEIGENAQYALTLKAGVEKALSGQFDVVLLDVNMPDGSGIEAIDVIKTAENSPEIIIITGDANTNSAELAMKSGVWDYLEKPLSPKKIILPLKRVLRYKETVRHIVKPGVKFNRSEIIGQSPRLLMCLEKLALAANSSANVLVTGESGTGKELFARALHNNSLRYKHSFVTIDCAAIPKTLVESTLFGHTKGAFTGAQESSNGLIYQADGGTLFLDEIGELSLPVQKTFLRVLQEKKFRPIGSKHEVKSDFHLVCATNKNLEKMVVENAFREDLLFRIRTFVIELPSLRERPEDIPLIAQDKIRIISQNYDMQPKTMSEEFVEMLKIYDWPGNVRELIHNIEQAVISSGAETVLYPKHLAAHIRIKLTRLNDDGNSMPSHRLSALKTGSHHYLSPIKEYREKALGKIEENYLLELMQITDWNAQQACHISGLSRSRLYALLKKYAITRYR